MELRLRVTRKRVAMVATAVAVVATGSVGWAAVGDGGTIRGCVTNNGTIDAIDPVTQACRDRQTDVEWYTKTGADASFLRAGAKAADADSLDGLDSSAFLGASAKAADADKLDGLDSSDFARGNVRVDSRTATITVAGGSFEHEIFQFGPSLGILTFTCLNGSFWGSGGQVSVGSLAPVHYWIDKGGDDLTFGVHTPGAAMQGALRTTSHELWHLRNPQNGAAVSFDAWWHFDAAAGACVVDVTRTVH